MKCFIDQYITYYHKEILCLLDYLLELRTIDFEKDTFSVVINMINSNSSLFYCTKDYCRTLELFLKWLIS
jgi:hypothetical protein